jgi:hypothetical protein
MTKKKNLERLTEYGENAIQEKLSERYNAMQNARHEFNRNNLVATKINYIFSIADYENMKNHAEDLGVKPALKVDLEDWKSILPNFDKRAYDKLLNTEE